MTGGGARDGRGRAADADAARACGARPQLREPLDVFVSHDWPIWITKHGDAAALFRKKPYFKTEVGGQGRGGGRAGHRAGGAPGIAARARGLRRTRGGVARPGGRAPKPPPPPAPPPPAPPPRGGPRPRRRSAASWAAPPTWSC